MFTGRLRSSQSHLKEALALYDAVSHSSLVNEAGVDPYVLAQAVLGGVLFCLGYPDQALAQSNAAILAAQRLAHQPSLAVTLAFDARLFLLVGDNSALGERAAQLIAVSTEQSFAYWRALGTIYDGWVKINSGNLAEGIFLLHSGSAAYCATGAVAWAPFHLGLLARAYEIGEQIDEAVTLLDDGLRTVKRTGERWFEAELNRQKGELLQRQEQSEPAAQWYRNARRIAKEQGAKLWELRATVSFARLRSNQGRTAEAHDLLAPIYGWFTEGFDIPDLKNAKALLEAVKGQRLSRPDF
jgi:predicted ATPase